VSLRVCVLCNPCYIRSAAAARAKGKTFRFVKQLLVKGMHGLRFSEFYRFLLRCVCLCNGCITESTDVLRCCGNFE